MFLRCFLSLILSGAAVAASATDLPSYSFVHVDATGATIAPPDIGQIDFEVSVTDKDPAQAAKVVNERLDGIRAAMQQVGEDVAEIQVRDIRTLQNKGDVPTYELRAGIKIMVRDLSKWKAVVTPLLDMPNLDGFVTAFDSTERESIEADLMKEALRLARRKADNIASGVGRKVIGVGGVSTGAIKNLSRSMDFTSADYQSNRGRAGQTDRGELIVVTALKLVQPVDVIFRLK